MTSSEPVERVVTGHSSDVERIAQYVDDAGEFAEFELQAPEVVAEASGGVVVQHVEPEIDDVPLHWLPIGSNLAGDPILVDLSSPELRVFTVYHDDPYVENDIAPTIDRLREGLRAAEGDRGED